jgi:hypothetical protein
LRLGADPGFDSAADRGTALPAALAAGVPPVAAARGGVAGLPVASAGVGRIGGGTRLPPLGGGLFPVTATHPIYEPQLYWLHVRL